MIAERYAGHPRVRYLLEPTPGASAGRNCGLRAATGEVVAFADDDVLVDRLWLRNLVLGFQAAPGVACVTGMILPAELETPAQVWIEEFGGFDKGYQRQIFDLGEFAPADPLYPYAVGRFGSGANAAFDPAVLRRVGGFDTALGPATPARGGEDIDTFLQIILAGYRLVYEPRSLVRHHHRRDYADLLRTVQSYGVGLSAVLTKALMNPGNTCRHSETGATGGRLFPQPLLIEEREEDVNLSSPVDPDGAGRRAHGALVLPAQPALGAYRRPGRSGLLEPWPSASRPPRPPMPPVPRPAGPRRATP